MRIFIHQANMVDKYSKQYKRNETSIAQTKTLEAHFKFSYALGR